MEKFVAFVKAYAWAFGAGAGAYALAAYGWNPAQSYIPALIGLAVGLVVYAVKYRR